MHKDKKLNVFISYCHEDEDEIKKFIKHLAPLKNNEMIKAWHDRKIIPGEDYQKEIDNNLEDADIICLFISANFLSSNSCMREKNYAVKLKNEKGIFLIPIILSKCGWRDDKEISPLLALPTDGEAVSKFDDPDTAWMDIYKGLKLVIEKALRIRQLKASTNFNDFLENTELLTKSHTQKEKVLLDDIFVSPELTKYNYDEIIKHEKPQRLEQMMNNLYNYSKIVIAGENQSGKTTLCKKFWIELRHKNYVPLYLFDKEKIFLGKIKNRIIKAFEEQYQKGVRIEEIDKDRIVLLIDDFHLAKHKENIMDALELYPRQILMVDDIFSLNFRSEALTKSFQHFKLNEFNPSRRDALIRKWLQIRDIDPLAQNRNTTYENIDRTTELVNSALGKILGRGIMPAYPFFILMLISVGETLTKPLDHEITSQGHCYQALIYNSLRRQNVKNNQIDTYMNFLTELASYIYQKGNTELSPDKFNIFMELYKDTYNLPVAEQVLLSNLRKTSIFLQDSFSNYSFSYSYLYFFFVGKYLAENLDENKDTIKLIINNLHKDDNAYIAAFISHHSKNIFVLDEIIKISSGLFQNCNPSTLNRRELHFFDEQVDVIKRASFPTSPTNPEQERDNKLKLEDELEQEMNDEDMNDEGELLKELRRGIKTVEVMGMIIKNRAGSLESNRLESVFQSGMEVHLRLMASFIELIREKEIQQIIIDFISSKISLLPRDEAERDETERDETELPNQQELDTLSRRIFWNLNFWFLYGFIQKTIHSLGSSQLTNIIRSVCERENTPASFLIMHGIFMWYSKNLRTDEIVDNIESADFSKVAHAIVEHQIVNHCRLHRIDYKDRQKIEAKLKISDKYLLPNSSK